MEQTTGQKFDLIAFDIDGTLTRSKLPLDSEMAELLCRLAQKYLVAIISGANYEQFKEQILDRLFCEPQVLKNLYLLPVDGTIFCYSEGWKCQSDTTLSAEEKTRIRKVFENIFEASGLERPHETYGEIVEDRGAQFNFSAFGQDAPIELKESWDPDNKKRQLMVKILEQALPGFSVRIGGTTSVEVTKSGVDKAYGLNKLMGQTGVSKEKILYVGDKLFEGGNDAPVLELGIESRSVKDPDETKKIILDLLD
ncbi:MAG: HAD-IIB family hydrolase [Parcubacteria group bacterium]